ncbi:uncharacterized protein LOC113213867 isoform X1 [Frankliniella occidentalis]|uniref:Uncharacterized protein LOC113213867 isoform X1 n=1 Tax=Frankliniella occidentalis TaxID=133901 RepID=A0A9C6TWX9_FRAOC|nr:uncharacterized protein LOC113213867 isoform X1 [Frankliniella occidentalis]
MRVVLALVALAAAASALADQHVVVLLNQIAPGKQATSSTAAPAATTKKSAKASKRVSISKRGVLSTTTEAPRIGSIHLILSGTAPPPQGPYLLDAKPSTVLTEERAAKMTTSSGIAFGVWTGVPDTGRGVPDAARDRPASSFQSSSSVLKMDQSTVEHTGAGPAAALAPQETPPAGGAGGVLKRGLTYTATGQAAAGPFHKESMRTFQKEVVHLGGSYQGGQQAALQSMFQPGPPAPPAPQMQVPQPGPQSPFMSASQPAFSQPSQPSQPRSLQLGVHTIELNITSGEGGVPQVSARHVSHAPAQY